MFSKITLSYLVIVILISYSYKLTGQQNISLDEWKLSINKDIDSLKDINNDLRFHNINSNMIEINDSLFNLLIDKNAKEIFILKRSYCGEVATNDYVFVNVFDSTYRTNLLHIRLGKVTIRPSNNERLVYTKVSSIYFNSLNTKTPDMIITKYDGNYNNKYTGCLDQKCTDEIIALTNLF